VFKKYFLLLSMLKTVVLLNVFCAVIFLVFRILCLEYSKEHHLFISNDQFNASLLNNKFNFFLKKSY